ncbi:MAG TPA: DoxX family protein [Nitrospirales bacterium]|nr:DoxX family protein [Nitrospirales bacterium]HIC04286.1 DoxX family protein [Nitrospirales bacterium]HIN34063.1 DoxX family protein [Nitrospirales bacterium]HIO69121.1 DoxX family protein [Nitrospirales bacterium]
MKMFFHTDDSLSSFVLRVTVGAVMFPHGAQKLVGWFGGYGFSGTMGAFTEKMGMPWIIAFLVIIGESLGALALIAGFMTRFVAASLAAIMFGAVAMAHWRNGFFMNWFGQQAGEGFEYHLLMIGMCFALILAGGGKWSVDQGIAKGLESD